MALRGLNWFGFEIGATLPDGLWQGPTALTLDFITVLRRIKLLGFNTIRLPMSLKVGSEALLLSGFSSSQTILQQCSQHLSF